ncbi:hypothetical protein DERF_004981 [Dermatophagoides farinae]|uniref:C2H2-type domain-containing protein n=1 Tax=Dermatophagoides farinae TaxID=6954 RepID=A0A922I8F9_DERFA|nr:hypothetical protein DERF_004981 [Dermatophagoides farinae]
MLWFFFFINYQWILHAKCCVTQFQILSLHHHQHQHKDEK